MTHRPSDEPAKGEKEMRVTLMSVTLVLFCIWLVMSILVILGADMSIFN